MRLFLILLYLLILSAPVEAGVTQSFFGDRHMDTDGGTPSDSTTTESDSGLEKIAGVWSLIRGCSNDEILKWNSVSSWWVCSADASAGSPATADITDVSVTQTEFAELETIGATTISANQWAALGGIAETLGSAELDLLDGLTVLSGSNTGDDDVPEVGDLDALVGGRSLTYDTGANQQNADVELYTDTKCIWFEDPTATDDFKSIWANKTANAFTLTEIWAESDQTVTFMLQIDDGTPADVDTVDLAPAAGEAEDTSLNGDTQLAAGEELDIDLVSVANTPTWVSICWTGTWDD